MHILFTTKKSLRRLLLWSLRYCILIVYCLHSLQSSNRLKDENDRNVVLTEKDVILLQGKYCLTFYFFALSRFNRDIVSWLFRKNRRRTRISDRTHMLYLRNCSVFQCINVFPVQSCFKISRRATVFCDVWRVASDHCGLVTQSITCDSKDYVRNLPANIVTFNSSIVPLTQGLIAWIWWCAVNASDNRRKAGACLMATFWRKSACVIVYHSSKRCKQPGGVK